MKPPGIYTCTDYRLEMTLLGLKRRREKPGVSEAEKKRIAQEIQALEEKMGMD